MKMSRFFGLLGVCGAAASATSEKAGAIATPISKVIQLLDEMAAKGTKEKEAEATRFSAFAQWCGDQSRIKTEEITDSTEKIEMLDAKIEKAVALIKALTARIEELDEDIGRWNKDTKSTGAIRAKEAADYTSTSQDFSESLEALDGALATLKKRSGSIAQADFAQVLLQVQRTVPSAKRALMSFLQQPDVEEIPDQRLSYQAPEAYGYEFQSGGVVEILERLKAEFEKKKYDLDAEEMKAQHAYEDIAQQMADNIENAQHEVDKKTARRAETQAEKSELEGEKAQTQSDRAEDQKYLDDMTGLCARKKEDFASRQELRAGELDALRQATEIMSSDSVAGSGEKHLPSLAQQYAVSFAQLRSGVSESALQSRVATFLSDRARLCSSNILALASQNVAASPFDKVKKMIRDLIWKLTEEGTEETEHKGWCDTELTTNKQTRDRKTEAVEKLTGTKEDLTATIAELTQDIEDLANAVGKLEAAMADAEQERLQSKETNEETIKDAEAAQSAVEQAIAILKDFYAKSAQATALTQAAQTPAEDAPETFDKPYKGMMTEGGGVLGFLDVILTDFTRLASETAASEALELDDHKKFMFDSSKDKALKENEKGHKQSKKEDKEGALAATEKELKLTQAQLDKAVEYYEKLKPTCVDSGITYEERVKRREEEVQSLQEALKILTGTDVSLS